VLLNRFAVNQLRHLAVNLHPHLAVVSLHLAVDVVDVETAAALLSPLLVPTVLRSKRCL
jgi:hypothetical protein